MSGLIGKGRSKHGAVREGRSKLVLSVAIFAEQRATGYYRIRPGRGWMANETR